MVGDVLQLYADIITTTLVGADEWTAYDTGKDSGGKVGFAESAFHKLETIQILVRCNGLIIIDVVTPVPLSQTITGLLSLIIVQCGR